MTRSQNSIAAATDVPPDVASTSHEYATRFESSVGKFFLQQQTELVRKLLIKSIAYKKLPNSKKILDLGGGHCQLTDLYLNLGFEITMQGSEDRSFQRAIDLGYGNNQRIKFNLSNLQQLNYKDNEFDFVSGIRLIAHLENWREFLDEMLRVAKYGIIFDFSNKNLFSLFIPYLFNFKKKIEGNTRPYYTNNLSEIKSYLMSQKISEFSAEGQFILPMAFHRMLNMPYFTKISEKLLAILQLKKLLGSPIIVCVSK
jgi:ubiquinone/menaquinone biosynthesis C-methylase UbiE